MDSVHDIAPDILMERGTSVSGREFLVAVTAAPDTGCIVGSKTYKPDIIISGGSAALAGCRHSRQGCSGTGGIDGYAGTRKFPVCFHGIRHGICKQKGSGIL